MIYKGTVVEFKKDNKSSVALCLECKADKLRLLCENKEISLPKDKVFFPSEYTLDTRLSREELVRLLKEINEERDNLKSSMPLKDIWELLSEEGGSYSVEELAELNFGKGFTSNQIAGVFRALQEDIIFFKAKKSSFYPNSPEHVEQIIQMLQAEKEKEERTRKIVDWLKKVWKGVCPVETDSEIESYISKLKHVALHKLESRHHKSVSELLQKADISGQNIHFRLLVKAGIWDEDECLELHQHQIPITFHRDILAEAINIVKGTEFDVNSRLNLSDLYSFTIDSDSTEDMDDALSIEKTSDGYKIGIHITDVSHYIAPGTALDQEAKERFTSVYLPENKINMFPQELANSLFSLRKDELRPAISVMIDIDNRYNMKNYEIKETFIKVKDRFTYDKVDELIGHESDFNILYKISEKMREKRKAGGAKLFYTPELEIKVDENKEITMEIYDRETPSHKLVSEMMIAANDITASFCKANAIPIIYRSQPPLDDSCVLSDTYDPVNFYQQRKYFKKSEAGIVPLYHYGLGIDCYTQMTSPIRRYNDLIIHRQLKSFLNKKPYSYTNRELEEIIMCSEQILDSVNMITRNRKRYWLLKYLKNMIGSSIRAIVLQNLSDRIVFILKDYFLELNSPNSTNYEKKYTAGDLITVKLETVIPREDVIKVSILDESED